MKYVRVKVNGWLIASLIVASIGSLDWPVRTFLHFGIVDTICGNIMLLGLTALAAMGLAGIYLLYTAVRLITAPAEG